MITSGYFLKILIISISLPILMGIALYPQTVIDPTLTLSAPGIVDQDDMCIWIDHDNKSLSTIISSDKTAYKLFVYDLSGNELQTIDVSGMPGNIDIRYNFMLSGVPTDIVSYNDRTNGAIVFYKVDRTTRQLSLVSSFSDGGMTGNNYGICLYHSLTTDKYYAIASSQSTQMKQWELVDNGNGTIGGLLKRTWHNGSGDITEGLVSDDELGFLYAANEGEGIYKYNAEPNDPDPVGELIAPTGVNGFTADAEGITIYYASQGTGYLIASSQGNSSFKIYERQAPHNYVKTVQVTGVGQTDGIDVSNLSLGPSFPLGLFLMHDGTGSPYVIRGCKWEDFGLEIDTTYWDPTTVLDSPTNLTATVVNQTQIDLSWTDNSNNEDGFKIERRLPPSTSWTEIDTIAANLTTYQDTGLTANTEYCYRVRAYNTGGNSDYSNEDCATTLPNAPTAPTNLAATVVSQTQIDLSWTDNSNNEDGFKIERRLPPSTSWTEIATVETNVTIYQDAQLTANTEYCYRVRAYNTGGNSDYSNEDCATTLPNAPTSPTNITATEVSQTQINLNWQDNSNNEDGFRIERKPGEGGVYTEIAAVGTNVITYQDTGLIANTEYCYRVRAYNTGGNSDYSNENCTVTLPDAPTPPTNLTSTEISQTQIDLSWTDNSNNEDGFRIERKPGEGGVYTEIAAVGTNVITYQDTGLAANTEYCYRLMAYNTGGSSGYSNEECSTTLPDAPTAPTNLVVTVVNQTQINLSWQDNSDNEDGFRIERKLGPGGVYTEIATAGANVTTYQDTGLTAINEYCYRVRAYNTGGNSSYSNEDCAATLPNVPAAPTNLTPTEVSQTQIDLSWTDNSNNEDGFRIERKPGEGGVYTEIAAVGTNVITYQDTGLAANTEYCYRVRAYNTGGSSGYSNEECSTTLPDAPTAPTNLVATVVNQTQIDLSWTDNSNSEDGFRIERKLGPGGVYTEIATAGANVTTYQDTGLTANTEYCYRVRAYNTGGNSGYSNEDCATTLPDAPTAPTNLTSTEISQTQIDISWTDNSNNEDGFMIERKLGPGGIFTEIATVGANVTTYQDTGLTVDTDYCYQVRAYNTGGNSGYSNEDCAATLPNAPTSPTNLTSTEISQTQIDLSWTDNSNNEDGFKIDRKLGPGGVYTEIARVGTNVTTYQDTGLTANTEYCYRLMAYNTGGNSGYSNEDCATTLLNVPTAPTNLTATEVSQTQIDLSWTDNSDNEDGFKIERKLGPGGVYTEIATVGANVITYQDTGLTVNTEYCYRVRAYNTGGNSIYSNEDCATTLPNTPTPPTNLTSTEISQTQINLSWTDNSNNEDGFKIERKLGPGGVYTEIATAGANVTTYQDTGLTVDTDYCYQVRAYNTGGNSGYSNEDCATTLPDAPAPPTNLTAAVVNQTQINLSWTDNSNNEDGFRIERKLGPGGVYTEIATAGANVTTYQDTGLTANTEYCYRVIAYNTGGNSGYSNEDCASTLPDAPTAPTNLTSTEISQTQINLSWTDNSNNEDGFKIERKLGPGGVYTEIATAGANVTTYQDTGLTANTEYCYRVIAYNTGGNSGYSNEDCASTLPDAPTAPTNLTSTEISQTQIDLSWTDNSNNEDGFKLERKLPPSTSWTEIDTIAANLTTYQDTGLTANTEYCYRVRAYNTGGNSDYSNEDCATTLPNAPTAPTNLAATVVSQTQIDLSWTDNSNNEDGFKIERRLPPSTSWTEIATVETNVTIYQDAQLTANTEYCYRVRAYNTGGNSDYSNEDCATTLPNAPTSPTNITATEVSQTQINLNWQDNSNNEDGFRIERKPGEGGVYTEIAAVGTNVITYQDTGLIANTEYCYRVRAYNTGGNSDYSNENCTVTLPDAPTPPTNLTSTEISQTQIDLSWTDNSNNEDGFRIERKPGEGGVYTEIAAVGTNVITYQDTGLAANTEYCYRLMAYNTGGSSGYSNEECSTTLPDAPTAPTNLVVTVVNQTQIDLSWTDNSGNEDGFKIERKQGTGGVYTEIATVGTNVTTYQDTGLTANTDYCYRVVSYNTGGNSGYSNEDCVITLPNVPAAPTNLAATVVSQTQIDLSWTDNSGNEDGFMIERKLGPGGVYTEIATVGANVITYQDTGLTVNTEYCYRVRAYNTGGNSIYSNEDCATTLPNTPTPPTNLTSTEISQTQINLSWTDNSNNEDGFKIERKLGPGGVYTEIATAGANVTTYQDTGLTVDTDYCYQVRAYNTGGNSGYSNEDCATTLPDAPAPPTNLTAAVVNQTQINLSWTDNSNNEDGFRIERKLGPGGVYTEIATAGANVTTYQDTGLTANTEYCYRVIAYNTGGNSGYSNEDCSTTNPTVPDSPTNLTATVVSQTQIDISWTDNSNNEDGFKIERKLGSGGDYQEIATVVANVAAYQDTALTANTEYCYRVIAYNTGGSSGYSNEDCATTNPTIPIPPGNLTSEATDVSEVMLSWTDNSSSEAGFIIERENTTILAFTTIDSVSENITSYIDSTVNQGISYIYRVSAYNISGQSEYSNASYVTSFLPAPTNLVGQLYSGPPSSVLLNWQDVSNNELGFVIERDTEGLGNFETLDSIASNLTSYEDTNFVIPTDTFYYRLYAVSQDTVSDYSNIAEIIIPVELVSFSASVFENSVTIRWVTATETNNMGFELGRKLYTVWEKLAFIEGSGSTTDESSYQYIDEFKNEVFKGVILYRLKTIDFSGAYEYSDIIEISADFKPKEFVFYQNYPNPFNPTTKIKYSIPKETAVTIKVFDILGEEVMVLVNEKQEAGTYEVEFDGSNLGSGIYFYQMQAESFSDTKKMLIIK